MTPEEQAAADAEQIKQLRDLAAEMVRLSKLGFDPLTVRKGIIAAVADTTTPPTVSINISGDETTLVSQVRTLNNYTPVVGQTVLIGKQGTEIFLLGAISAANPTSVNNTTDNGWIRADLDNGSHGGNSNGDVYYRRVMDHGSWKMQWRGGWAPGGATTMITGLDPDYRPTSLRSLLCARALTGSVAAQLDFKSDGSVVLTGGSTTVTSATVSLGGSTDGDGDHSHGISDTYGASGEFVQSDGTSTNGYHSHSWSDSASHTHTPSAPAWISLNGLEYFL